MAIMAITSKPVPSRFLIASAVSSFFAFTRSRSTRDGTSGCPDLPTDCASPTPPLPLGEPVIPSELSPFARVRDQTKSPTRVGFLGFRP